MPVSLCSFKSLYCSLMSTSFLTRSFVIFLVFRTTVASSDANLYQKIDIGVTPPDAFFPYVEREHPVRLHKMPLHCFPCSLFF